jgi:hypothetical protein
MNRFSTLCGWLAQRQGWRVKGWIWPSEQPRSAKTDLTIRWATGNDNFVYSSLWDFKSSFTCRKILRQGTFPLYFPSDRKVCCGFLSPLKIHRLGRVLKPQPLGPVASTLTTTPPRRLYTKIQKELFLPQQRRWRQNYNQGIVSAAMVSKGTTRFKVTFAIITLKVIVAMK